LEDEFFAQGDRERALGFPQISFLMDREKAGASETQVGFMDFVVLPLFRALASALLGAGPLLEGAEANRERWQKQQATPKSVEASMPTTRSVDCRD